MFTAEDIRAEMNRLDGVSGVDTTGIHISVSSKMTTTMGKCRAIRRRRGDPYEVTDITFSKYLLLYGSQEHFLETVRHEYAHAFVFLCFNKNDGHGPLWKAAALRFGGTGNRTMQVDEVMCEIAKQNPKTRYVVTCTTCGRVFVYQRAGKTVKALQKDPKYSGAYCPSCKGKHFILKSK